MKNRFLSKLIKTLILDLKDFIRYFKVSTFSNFEQFDTKHLSILMVNRHSAILIKQFIKTVFLTAIIHSKTSFMYLIYFLL